MNTYANTVAITQLETVTYDFFQKILYNKKSLYLYSIVIVDEEVDCLFVMYRCSSCVVALLLLLLLMIHHHDTSTVLVDDGV